MQRMALGMVAIVLLASTAPAALASNQGASGYAGSTLSFDATSNALVDYSVGGATMAESIRVQSQSEAETDSGLSLGASADLGAVVNLTGAAVSVDSSTETGATVQSESGATLHAHDNGHGSLVIQSGGDSQYVEVGMDASSSASAEGDDRVVVVTADDGTDGAFVVVGNGSVTVNDQGNVSAAIDGDSRLVFRSYPDGRDDADRESEQLIADGTAAATVYASGDGTGVVSYDDGTDVSVTSQSESNLTMNVERAHSEGRVVIASMANQTASSAEDVSVTVDGEAAIQASSYSELRGATNDGENSMYMVQQSQASGSADVLVGVNHFSTREVAVSDSGSSGEGASSGGNDGGSDGGDGGDDPTSGLGPGFGAVGALVAVVAGSALLAYRRV